MIECSERCAFSEHNVGICIPSGRMNLYVSVRRYITVPYHHELSPWSRILPEQMTATPLGYVLLAFMESVVHARRLCTTYAPV